MLSVPNPPFLAQLYNTNWILLTYLLWNTSLFVEGTGVTLQGCCIRKIPSSILMFRQSPAAMQKSSGTLSYSSPHQLSFYVPAAACPLAAFSATCGAQFRGSHAFVKGVWTLALWVKRPSLALYFPRLLFFSLEVVAALFCLCFALKSSLLLVVFTFYMSTIPLITLSLFK